MGKEVEVDKNRRGLKTVEEGGRGGRTKLRKKVREMGRMVTLENFK